MDHPSSTDNPKKSRVVPINIPTSKDHNANETEKILPQNKEMVSNPASTINSARTEHPLLMNSPQVPKLAPPNPQPIPLETGKPKLISNSETSHKKKKYKLNKSSPHKTSLMLVGTRVDCNGYPIIKGGKNHKITFKDDMVRVIHVESYKRYNTENTNEATKNCLKCLCQKVMQQEDSIFLGPQMTPLQTGKFETIQNSCFKRGCSTDALSPRNTPSLTTSTTFIGLLSCTEKKILRFLPLIYSRQSVLENKEIQAIDRETIIKQVALYDKAYGFNLETPLNISVLLSDRTKTLQGKMAKNYRWTIFKIICCLNGKFSLYIHDCFFGDSLTVNLEQINKQPCKSLGFDPINNYIFLFDNKESIYVLSGKIDEKWANVKDMNSRIIGTLQLFSNRTNPILYCFNTTNGPVLLVVGGYTEKKGCLIPLQDILVFSCNFSEFSNIPSLKIRMRYPRPEPLVGHIAFHEKNDGEINMVKRLYIFGGVNSCILKLLKPNPQEKHLLLEGNSFCETLLLEDLESELYKTRVLNQSRSFEIPEIQTKQTFELCGDEPFMKSRSSLARGALKKIYNRISANRTLLMVGVGNKKQHVYEMAFVDEKGQKVQMYLKGKMLGENKFLSNHMFCLKNDQLCYISDKNEEEKTYYRIDLFDNDEPVHCKMNCNIF